MVILVTILVMALHTENAMVLPKDDYLKPHILHATI